MQFSTAFVTAVSLSVAAAQNAFTMTTIPSVIHVGSPFNLTWGATTPGDVSIWLVQGPASDIKYVSTVAANITNSGSFDWTPSSSIASGSNYALEIVDDGNSYITNWSGQFSIDGGSSGVDSSDTNSTSTSAASSGSTPSTTTSSSSGSKTTMATVTSSQTSSSSTTSSSATTSASGVPNTNANGAAKAGAQVGLSVFVLGALTLIVL